VCVVSKYKGGKGLGAVGCFPRSYLNPDAGHYPRGRPSVVSMRERERAIRLGLLIRHPSVWIKARGPRGDDAANWLHTNPQPLPSNSCGRAIARPPVLALVTLV
jgi:hypothetical protein